MSCNVKAGHHDDDSTVRQRSLSPLANADGDVYYETTETQKIPTKTADGPGVSEHDSPEDVPFSSRPSSSGSEFGTDFSQNTCEEVLGRYEVDINATSPGVISSTSFITKPIITPIEDIPSGFKMALPSQLKTGFVSSKSLMPHAEQGISKSLTAAPKLLPCQ